jgi:hypothetical protein
MGSILTYNNGQLQSFGGTRAQVWMDGDVRDIALLKFKKGRHIVVTRNDGKPGVYQLSD